jgi:hypothetical protein
LDRADHIAGELAQFVVEHVDTIPHLEVLLLLMSKAHQQWSVAELAERIYQGPEATTRILEDLRAHGLAAPGEDSTENWRYEPRTPERDAGAQLLARAYRTDLRAVTNLVHSKASRAVLEFARAFRLQRE